MKMHYVIGVVALMVCIGFIPTTTAASFEPQRLGFSTNQRGLDNQTVVQFAIETMSDGTPITVYEGSYCATVIVVFSGTTVIVYHDHLPVVHINDNHETLESFLQTLDLSS